MDCCISCAKPKKINKSGDWKGLCTNCYQKQRSRIDPVFFLNWKYDEIYQRCKAPRVPKLMQYKGMEFLSRKELVRKYKYNKRYLRMFQQWVDSGWAFILTPTLDRIDNERGYTTDNIQMITFDENNRKDKLYKKQIDVWTVGGRYIGLFKDRFVISKELNIPQVKIWSCLYGTIKSTYGYKFKWREHDIN